MQDKGLYEDLSSPTVSQETVMTTLAIAAIERRRVATVDITGAYLECKLPDEDEVFMRLDPLLASMVAEVDPSAKVNIDDKGVLFVRLERALYGCVQSSKLWYDKLCEVLEADGFKKNNYDPCLFNKTVDGAQVTVAFHVDDLLVTSKSQKHIDELMNVLRGKFAAITVNTGSKHSYLSMNIEVNRKGIHVDMRAYIDKCLEEKDVSVRYTSPAGEDLFTIDENSKLLDDVGKKQFHSDVARLLYLGKRTRGQILTAVSHLATRVGAPTENDQKKLLRIMGYLKRTRDEVMHMKPGGKVQPEVYIDASFGVHHDGTSRTGMCVMLGGVAVGNWSMKQRLVTKSSTEAEVVGLSDGLTSALWMRELLGEQGYDMGPMKVYQDNQGVISIMKAGRRPNHRTRHLNVRHFFARDRMISGDIEFEYKNTCEMIADLLTKPVTGALFEKLSAMATGQEVERPESRIDNKLMSPMNSLSGLLAIIRGTISGV